MCSNGQINGAAKFGKVWAIPISAEKQIDSRVTSGEYRDWRNNKKRVNNELE